MSKQRYTAHEDWEGYAFMEDADTGAIAWMGTAMLDIVEDLVERLNTGMAEDKYAWVDPATGSLVRGT